MHLDSDMGIPSSLFANHAIALGAPMNFVLARQHPSIEASSRLTDQCL